MILMMIDDMQVITVAGILYYTRDAKVPSLVLIVTSCIPLFFLWHAPESPKFLYANEKWDELRKTFYKLDGKNSKLWSYYKFDAEVKPNVEKTQNAN